MVQMIDYLRRELPPVLGPLNSLNRLLNNHPLVTLWAITSVQSQIVTYHHPTTPQQHHSPRHTTFLYRQQPHTTMVRMTNSSDLLRTSYYRAPYRHDTYNDLQFKCGALVASSKSK